MYSVAHQPRWAFYHYYLWAANFFQWGKKKEQSVSIQNKVITSKMFQMKYCFLLLFSCIGFFSFSQDSLTITGKLTGLGESKLYLSFANNEGKNESYTSTSINDAFSFKVKKQSLPVVARLALPVKRDSSQKALTPSVQLTLFVYQSDVEIRGRADDLLAATLKGGENNNLKILTGSEKPGSEKRQIISYNCLPYFVKQCNETK